MSSITIDIPNAGVPNFQTDQVQLIQNDRLYAKGLFSEKKRSPIKFEDFTVFRPGFCDASTFEGKELSTCHWGG